MRSLFISLILVAAAACVGCGSNAEVQSAPEPPAAQLPPAASPSPIVSPSPAIPNLQKEILDSRYKTTSSPIGSFDFRNFSYDMPRGWENPDGSQITLVNGRVLPVKVDIDEDMTPEEKAERKAMRRIGLSFVTVRYMDADADGEDEAVVILKIETGGTAIPQVVHIFKWRAGEPELLWMFRTGDRADGGLKDIRVESGLVVVELYGQDRFILGSAETGKVTGDEEQLCCPIFFTRTAYKWNGNTFLMQGKRLTYSITDPSAAPLENWGETANDPKRNKK
jgi:hypothetical protein